MRVRDWIAIGIPPAEIAVVARDPQRMASLVHHAFRERGVPIDVGTHADSATEGVCARAGGCAGRDSDGRFAEALHASPLLDRFCIARDLPRDASRAVSTLRASYAGAGGFDLAGMLHEHVAPIASAHTVDRIANEWDRYAEVVAHHRVASPRSTSSGTPTSTPPRRNHRAGNMPSLLSARAMSGRTVRAAVILGCADGLFPPRGNETGYMPLSRWRPRFRKRVRALRATSLRASTASRAEREENALLLSALVCARDELCVSHPRKSGDQVLTIPAPLAPLFANADELARDTSAAFHASSRVTRSRARAELAGAAHAIEPIAGGWLLPPAPPSRPVFEKMPLSPSRLDTYTRCERKFFFQRCVANRRTREHLSHHRQPLSLTC